MPKIHLATSRPIGQKCIAWLEEQGIQLSSMDDCEIFISVLYDQLIPEEYINTHKCYNFHPGILPWYRGSGAYSWAIINGEFETGVTLHVIDKDIDHGDVIDIMRFPVTESDTAETLYREAEKVIFLMFKIWFKTLVSGKYPRTKQVEGHVYLRKHLDKQKDLTKFVRAFTFEGKDNAFYMRNNEKILCKM